MADKRSKMMLLEWLQAEVDMKTLLPAVANSLSFMTIVSCLFMKIPQIISIKQQRSAEGIYVQALAMEIIGFTIMTLYNYLNNYGTMTYLEYPIILFQVYVMMYLVLKYKGMLDMPIVPLMTTFYFACISGFLIGVLPKNILSLMIPICTPLSGIAKVTYIYGIIKAGNADNMSLATWTISVLTNLSRVFTVYVDSADSNLIFNFLVSTMLSCAVLGTTIFYQATACPVERALRKKYGRYRRRND